MWLLKILKLIFPNTSICCNVMKSLKMGCNAKQMCNNSESLSCSDTASDCGDELWTAKWRCWSSAPLPQKAILSFHSQCRQQLPSCWAVSGEVSILEMGGHMPVSFFHIHLNKRQIVPEDRTEEALVCSSHLPDAADRTSNGLKW